MSQWNILLFIVLTAGFWTALEGWSRGRPGSLAIIVDLEDRIYSLSRQLEKFELNVTRYRNTEKLLSQFFTQFYARRDQAAEAAFLISSISNRRKYYVKKHLNRFDYETAQATCALFDGYLAEISGQTELTFLANFLKESGVPEQRAVYVGAWFFSGQWVYGRTGSPIRSFPWQSGFPQSQLNQNCACLKSKTLRQCHCPEMEKNDQDNSNAGRSYVCEVQI